ncbi:TIGR00297 family protein, partial [Coleofasciculus sp. FACHB-712]|nr:TIGR00297 family protein [Coleofasciculus sp. FACHB-712]
MLSTINSFNPWLVAVGLNTVLLAIAYFAPKKLLTPAGFLHAWA